MSVKQELHQLHLNEWAARFFDQKSSGFTVRQWCDQTAFLSKLTITGNMSSKKSLPINYFRTLFHYPIPLLHRPCSLKLTKPRSLHRTARQSTEDFLHALIKAVRHA